jgi:hypothetical protein
MAGQKASIDKDTSSYRSSTSAPESERETAYHSQKDLEGTDLSADRNGNKDDVFNGSTKARQGRRKADQTSAGTTGIGDTGNGLEKMESTSPFSKVLSARFGLSEAENPGTASSAATSDNPSLGMYSVNNSDFRQPKADVRSMLEAIALQAAETFEALDENKSVPDALSSELDQCSKVIDKLYEYVTNTTDDGEATTGNTPVQKEPPAMPPMKEDVEWGFCIRAESLDGFKFVSEPMSEEEAEYEMEEMIDSGAYLEIEMEELSPKQKKIARLAGDPDEIDADDLGALRAGADINTLRAKKKMSEAFFGVFNHIIREE